MRTSVNIPNINKQQSLFALLCKSADFAPNVDPDEIFSVHHECKGNRIHGIDCKDKELSLFLEEVDGLGMSSVKVMGYEGNLEKFIPIVPKGMFKKAAETIPYQVVGVMLNDILTKQIRSRHGYYYFPDDTEINTEILKNPIFHGKQVILFCAGQDVLLEGLWWRREKKKVFEKIGSIGFLATTGMNFSLFLGECPLQHALNTKKSLYFCQELEKFGVRTIPHIYALNIHQRERWISWLLENPSVKIININTQLQKNQSESMNAVFETIKVLLERTEVEIIIHGRARGIPQELKKKYGNRLHYTASGPLKNALIRKDKTVSEYISIFMQGIEAPLVL